MAGLRQRSDTTTFLRRVLCSPRCVVLHVLPPRPVDSLVATLKPPTSMLDSSPLLVVLARQAPARDVPKPAKETHQNVRHDVRSRVQAQAPPRLNGPQH